MDLYSSDLTSFSVYQDEMRKCMLTAFYKLIPIIRNKQELLFCGLTTVSRTQTYF